MRRILTILSAACGAVLLTSTLAGAQINSDRLTYVTFSAPVALPGATLPAGTYAFKLLDSPANRNVVQIFDKEQTKLFATVMAIAAQRNEPTDDTVITFREAPSNAAPAVRFWYYPGEKAGQEFAYPKAQAALIANATRESVLAIDTESSDVEAMKGGAITRVQPGAEATAPAPAAEPGASAQASAQSAPPNPTPPAEPTPPAAATTTAPALTEPARPADVTTPEPAPVGTSGTSAARAEEQAPSSPAPATPATPATTTSQAQLPQTASRLPILALAGLLALGGALSVRALARAKA